MLNHLYTRHTSNSLLGLKSESKERKQRLLFDEGICILICFAGTAISSLGREGKRKLDREHYKGTHDHSIYKEGLPFRTPADWKSEFKLSPCGWENDLGPAERIATVDILLVLPK